MWWYVGHHTLYTVQCDTCLAWHSLHQLCSSDGEGLFHSLAHLSLYSSGMQQPILWLSVWNSEIWTTLGHVNGAGSVCELWPVARKMFIQNFATLKLTWVGSQICCIHRSFSIPLTQLCFESYVQYGPWQPVVLVAVTRAHRLSMVGYVPALAWNEGSHLPKTRLIAQ
jgi:hypothetical protein